MSHIQHRILPPIPMAVKCEKTKQGMRIVRSVMPYVCMYVCMYVCSIDAV